MALAYTFRWKKIRWVEYKVYLTKLTDKLIDKLIKIDNLIIKKLVTNNIHYYIKNVW